MAGTDLLNTGLPQTFNVQKNPAVSVKQNKAKHNKTRYAWKAELPAVAKCLRLTSSRKASLTDSHRITQVTPTPSSWHCLVVPCSVVSLCSFFSLLERDLGLN